MLCDSPKLDARCFPKIHLHTCFLHKPCPKQTLRATWINKGQGSKASHAISTKPRLAVRSGANSQNLTCFPGLSFQMLHNKHVMVRVGGGWETFAGYLLKHDPCRMLQISRVDGKTSPVQSKSPTLKDMNPDNYLVVSASYKAKKEIKWSWSLKGDSCDGLCLFDSVASVVHMLWEPRVIRQEKALKVALFIFNASVELHLKGKILKSEQNQTTCKQIIISQYVNIVFRTNLIRNSVLGTAIGGEHV